MSGHGNQDSDYFYNRVVRECCNEECGWKGHTRRMLGNVGPLCPDCGEVTEAASGVDSSVATVSGRVWTEAEMLAAIRKVGGIVHSDGNVFFTNWGRMLAAVDELAKVARGVDAARGLSGEAWSAVTKRCFDTGGNAACADVLLSRCALCPNRKDASGVQVGSPDAQQQLLNDMEYHIREGLVATPVLIREWIKLLRTAGVTTPLGQGNSHHTPMESKDPK
jgi:hypothetical protein